MTKTQIMSVCSLLCTPINSKKSQYSCTEILTLKRASDYYDNMDTEQYNTAAAKLSMH
jgi:hypothetical protein